MTEDEKDIFDSAFNGDPLPDDEQVEVVDEGAPSDEADAVTVEEDAPRDEAVEAVEPEAKHVPLNALLDERDKRKKLEQELEALRQQKPQAAVQQVQAPDIFEDPDQYNAYIEDRITQERIRFSEQIAVMKHGEDTVKEAVQWGVQLCDVDPHFNAQVKASPDPIGFVLDKFQRDKISQDVTPDKYKQFLEWQQSQAAPAPTSTPASVQQARAAPPPSSIANVSAAGRAAAQVPLADEDIFASVFKV